MAKSAPHVLFINRVCPPAAGATGAILAELAERLVQRGWRVTVVTGPAEGEPASTMQNGVCVERVSALRFTRASTWRRALAYLSHYPAFLARALRLERPDVVVSKTDPPLHLVISALLQAIWRVPAVHWAQDVYPEIAEELGVIPKNGWLARLLRTVSTQALHRHHRVVTVGRCMQERIVRRGYPKARTRVIPNWPPDTVHPVPHEANDFRAAHDLQDRFVVMYSGNMGLAHPFDTVLDAAARVQRTHPDMFFAFVGDGPRKQALHTQVHERGLDNVRFFPYQPMETLAHSLSAADVHIVTMQPKLTGLVVPSKLYGVLAAGRPAVFIGPPRSEAAQVLREHTCGSVLDRPAADELADTLREWYAGAEERSAAGQRARRAVEDAAATAAADFDTVLQTCVRASAYAT